MLEVTGFKLSWLSIGYDATNAAFRRFDQALPFTEQVVKDSYLSHAFHVRYAVYQLSRAPYETYYWSLGVTGAVTNNLSGLKKLELVERLPFGPNPTDRVAETRFQAFQGDYRKGLSSAAIAGDFYWFLFPHNRAAVHLYPEYVLKESQRPRANLGAGFLLAFKDSKKPQTTVSAELYVQFTDLGNGARSSDRVIDRKSVGVRVAFPINFSSRGNQ
jgi:hypothetical protein